jgi:hypothetical protein
VAAGTSSIHADGGCTGEIGSPAAVGPAVVDVGVDSVMREMGSDSMIAGDMGACPLQPVSVGWFGGACFRIHTLAFDCIHTLVFDCMCVHSLGMLRFTVPFLTVDGWLSLSRLGRVWRRVSPL